MLRTHLQKRINAGSRTSGYRFMFVFALSVASLLTLAACSPFAKPGAISGPAATPTAQQILANAQKAHLTDETFTLTLTGTSSGTALKATGNGKATVNPSRVSLSLSMDVSGTTVAFDEIIDDATKASYTQITAPAILATGKWVKGDSSSSSVSGSDLQVLPPYSKLTNVKLVGGEQLNGVSVWHIKATIPAEGTTTTGDTDLYLRQSDYLPAQMVIKTSGDTAATATIVYTSVNTGIKIDLPNV